MAYRKAWEVGYQRDRAAGRRRYVDAEPVRARLAELDAAHVPLRAMARAAGLSDTGVKAILDGSRRHVQRLTAERVAALSLQRVYAEQTSGHVPRIGAVRRVQALMALGWSHRDIAAAGAPNTPNLLATGGHLVTAQRWREVRDVFDRLSMTPGPSAETRGWAKALGTPRPWPGMRSRSTTRRQHRRARWGRGRTHRWTRWRSAGRPTAAASLRR